MKHVESLFFGDEGHLFGMFHPATGRSQSHAVVVCAPLFNEHYRSHFALQRIAVELANRGYDVLRFDYSGTGDSKGDIPSNAFTTWSAEIGVAIAEVRALSGKSLVSLVTTRYSATLGLPWQSGVRNYVCWDPVLDPHTYAKEVDEINRLSLAEHPGLLDDERARLEKHDYVGCGVSRSAVKEALSAFAEYLNKQGLSELPERSVNISSDTDWVCPHLERIYAHETIREVTDAF